MSVEEGGDRAKAEGIMFIETSAKGGYNIKALFRKLATALPGMETAPVTSNANLIDIKVRVLFSFVIFFLPAFLYFLSYRRS